jgi:hypothetical protein
MYSGDVLVEPTLLGRHRNGKGLDPFLGKHPCSVRLVHVVFQPADHQTRQCVGRDLTLVAEPIGIEQAHEIVELVGFTLVWRPGEKQ